MPRPLVQALAEGGSVAWARVAIKRDNRIRRGWEPGGVSWESERGLDQGSH